jgi:hypothetical protein
MCSSYQLGTFCGVLDAPSTPPCLRPDQVTAPKQSQDWHEQAFQLHGDLYTLYFLAYFGDMFCSRPVVEVGLNFSGQNLK